MDVQQGQAFLRQARHRERSASTECLAGPEDLDSRHCAAGFLEWQASAGVHAGRAGIGQGWSMVQDRQRHLLRRLHGHPRSEMTCRRRIAKLSPLYGRPSLAAPPCWYEANCREASLDEQALSLFERLSVKVRPY